MDGPRLDGLAEQQLAEGAFERLGPLGREDLLRDLR